MDGEYELRLHCHNCGRVIDYIIPKGMRVVTVPCENCGVKALRRLDKYVADDIADKARQEVAEELGLHEV